MQRLHGLIDLAVVPAVAVRHDVRGAVLNVEIVQRDQRVADEVRMRARNRPQAVVLVQELAGLARQHVEERGDVDLHMLAEHAFDQGANATVEEQMIHGAGLRQQVVGAPGLAGVGADGAHLRDRHLGVEGVPDARHFVGRQEVLYHRVAVRFDLGDPFGDVQAVDDGRRFGLGSVCAHVAGVHSATRTMRVPTLPPASMSMKARGISSRPWNSSCSGLSWPASIHSRICARPSA